MNYDHIMYKKLNKARPFWEVSLEDEAVDNFYLGKSAFFRHGQPGVADDRKDLVTNVLRDGVVNFGIPIFAHLTEPIRFNF